MGSGGIKHGRGLEGLEFSVGRGGGGFVEDGGDVVWADLAESFSGFKGLIQNYFAVDAGDNDRSGKTQGEVQALDRSDGFAFENMAVAHGFHSKHTDLFFYENRKHQLAETAEMRVHHVERHLHGVEIKVMFFSQFEHAQVNRRIFMAGEAIVANLSSAFCFGHGLGRAALCKKTVGVFETNVFVELPEVDVVDLQAL